MKVLTEQEIENIKIQAQIDAYENSIRIYGYSYPLVVLNQKINDLKHLLKETT